MKFAASARDAAELRSTRTCATNSGDDIAPASSATLLRALLIKIRHDDVGALAREQQSDFATDSAGASNDESDLAAELRFRGHALQLGFFESPILDAERL